MQGHAQTHNGPKRKRKDLVGSFLGGGLLLGLAGWGIACIVRDGDTFHENPSRWGGGSSPVGWTVAFIAAVFGVALVWRGVDRWRTVRCKARSEALGINCAPPDGSPGTPANIRGGKAGPLFGN